MVALRNIKVGNVNLSSISIAGDCHLWCPKAGDINLSTSTIAGRYHIWGTNASSVDLSSSRIVGPCFLGIGPGNDNHPIKCQNLDANKAEFAAGLTIRGIDVAGGLRLDGATLGGNLFILPSGHCRPRVRGELNLSVLRGRPFTQIEALDNDGGIMILSAETGDLRFRPGRVESQTADGKPGIDIFPCRTARLLIRNTTVHGGLSLPLILIQVDGTIDTYDVSGVAIENCEINGDVEFWRPTLFDDMAREVGQDDIKSLPAWEYGAAIIGPVLIKNTRIGGRCDLSFLKASGKIEVTDGAIKNDLNFSSTLSLTARNAPACNGQKFPQRAYAAGLSLRMLTVENDIDLSGLTLFEDNQNPWCNKSECGKLDGRYIRVSGDITAHRRETSESETLEAYVEVPASLDLGFASGGRLTVSGHSFPPPGVKDAPNRMPEDHGIVLVHATFRQIVFPHIDRSTEGCPVPLDLSAASVTDWEVGSEDTPLQQRYETLLNNARPFRRDSYRRVEQHLRNQGNDREADSIYRSMMVRDRCELRKGIVYFLGVPKYQSFKRLLGFGTNLWPLFGIIVALALVSYPVYRNPANIEPSLAKLATATTRETVGKANKFIFAGKHPDSEQWSVWDALWLMARTHIPIISLAVRDEWELSDDSRFTYDFGAFMSGEGWCKGSERLTGLGPTSRWFCKRSAYERRGLSPQDWGAVMMILSWILWPLLLAFLLPRLLRR